ncbi:hypothetical protein Q7C_584 [Methylophaga frappieri]|uniref:DUF4124 domain-containing protein n=2 Tax=Methylophaga frappieri (strain ATCC BAA-2434 / DSM 25690 / JAM7) TaxID=754477 RepID=I1YFR3_METFJ|nr:hypothetical protein Q7C_584 [Methylophaga frappieri]
MPIWLAYIVGMKKIIALLLCFLPVVITAEVYRWVDENGNTVFSDQPVENAEPVDLPEASTYSPVDLPDIDPDSDETDSDLTEEEATAVPDYEIGVVSPQDDETMRINNGNLTVNIEIRPALSSDRQDKIQLNLDGRPHGEPLPQLSFSLENLDRGTHTLSASVINQNGEVIAESPQIKFHLQRNSILLNPNTRNVPAP